MTLWQIRRKFLSRLEKKIVFSKEETLQLVTKFTGYRTCESLVKLKLRYNSYTKTTRGHVWNYFVFDFYQPKTDIPSHSGITMPTLYIYVRLPCTPLCIIPPTHPSTFHSIFLSFLPSLFLQP
jgi:hypothetical protein